MMESGQNMAAHWCHGCRSDLRDVCGFCLGGSVHRLGIGDIVGFVFSDIGPRTSTSPECR